jgi:hypothetical protein
MGEMGGFQNEKRQCDMIRKRVRCEPELKMMGQRAA